MGKLPEIVFSLIIIALLVSCINKDEKVNNSAKLPTISVTKVIPSPTVLPYIRFTNPMPMPDVVAPQLIESEDCRGVYNMGSNLCYELQVYEDRSNPNSKIITLPVIIIKRGKNHESNDSILFLSGEPLEIGNYFYSGVGFNRGKPPKISFSGFKNLDQNIVVIGGRTAEISAWNHCSISGNGQHFSNPEFAPNEFRVQQICLKEFKGKDIEISSYTSLATAADIEDLRTVLGVEKWNIFGTSYGSRIGFSVMEQYPDTARSAVFDSVVPPQINLFRFTPLTAEDKGSLSYLLKKCKEDAICNSAYPNLEDTLINVIEDLNANPIEITFSICAGGGVCKPGGLYLLNGYKFVDVIFNFMKSEQMAYDVPRLIYDAKNKDFDRFRRFVYSSSTFYSPFNNSWSILGISHICMDESPIKVDGKVFETTNRLDELLFPYFQSQVNLNADICINLMANNPNVDHNQPVQSNTPVLLLAGEYDPVTPVSWAKMALVSLPNSKLIEFQGYGHEVTFSNAQDCVASLLNGFWDNPFSPLDISCVSKLKQPGFAPKQ